MLPLLFLCVSVGLGLAIFREFERVCTAPINSWSEDQTADCAVVLTGGANRTREGVDLLARHSVRKLIISGVNPQAELMDIFPQLPFYGTVMTEDVILEKRSQSTYGNAQQSLPLVEALRCRDVLLVTSRLHMYRALRTFRAEFPTTIVIYPRAVFGGYTDLGWSEILLEASKSLFYSLWAY